MSCILLCMCLLILQLPKDESELLSIQLSHLEVRIAIVCKL